jgi:nitrite reductase/ring-hydroxylating ferredoxin subunit
MKTFVINDIEILVGRRRLKLFAFNNSCPHRGASLSKGEFNNNNIVCYMHGYEFNVFTGKLVDMKSWKKDDTWLEQRPEWREAGNLILYNISEEDGRIYLDMP